QAACLRTVAVGRTVVLEAVAVVVVVGLVVCAGVVPVHVLVGAESAVGACVGVLHRRASGLPVQRGFAAPAVPALAQLGFGLGPVAASGLVAILGAHAVCRGVVTVEIAVALVVLAAGGVLSPVLDFGGGVHAFG